MSSSKNVYLNISFDYGTTLLQYNVTSGNILVLLLLQF